MPIIDTHVHIYPEKIAERATASVGQFYGVTMAGDGTLAGMHALCKGSQITHHVVHSVAVKPKNVESINDFIASACAGDSSLIGFMTIHQDFPNPEVEVERAQKLGLRGIKLHPDMQQVAMDDERLMRVYDIAQACHLPVIIHCGDYRTDLSHPARLCHVLREFPDLVVDAAHFGGWSICDLALEYLENERCFLDASSSFAFMGPRRARELICAYGLDRVMYGSDFPMWNPTSELEFLMSLGFSDEEYADLTWHNAERFLGMTVE